MTNVEKIKIQLEVLEKKIKTLKDGSRQKINVIARIKALKILLAKQNKKPPTKVLVKNGFIYNCENGKLVFTGPDAHDIKLTYNNSLLALREIGKAIAIPKNNSEEGTEKVAKAFMKYYASIKKYESKRNVILLNELTPYLIGIQKVAKAFMKYYASIKKYKSKRNVILLSELTPYLIEIQKRRRKNAKK